ncbi:MAG: hypothetical protein K8U03_11930 [Planctomycetia bacterium]|nr:hypothetical protein [Planctomycetia bacterium]
MKRLLNFVALVGFSAISLAAVVRVVRTELAPQDPFDHAALEAWLIGGEAGAEDVALATPKARRAARLLERDFHDDFDWRPFYEQLDPAARDRFNAHVAALGLLLFEQRAERYASLPRHDRERYLDGQLNDFAHWYLFAPDGRKIQGIELFQSSAFASTLRAEKSSNEQKGSPALRSASAALLRDLQARVVSRALQRFVPSAREKKRRED